MKAPLMALALIAFSCSSAWAADRFGALAVDRDNSFSFGWASDQTSLAEANHKALKNCTKNGGDCSVLLNVTRGANRCGVYRSVNKAPGSAYGWAKGPDRESADRVATRNCLAHSGGQSCPNQAWTCNTAED